MRKITLMVAAALLATLPALAQDKPAKVHGHIQDSIGIPVADATVILSDDPSMQNPRYTFTSDADGNYTGDNIKPGTYVFSLRKGQMARDKVLDQFTEVKVAAGADLTQNFDMTRPDYISKMTPEEKKAVEETRRKNAEVLKENAGIKNLNANLIKARDDNKAKNYTEAESLMQQATTQDPTRALLWLELGNAQSGLKKYPDAETSLKKSLDLETASKKPDPATEGAINNSLGEVYANENKMPDSIAAYEAAAKLNPTQAGMYYQNQAIMFTRINQSDAAAAAADKAIAAEPTRAIPYYLKGQALVGKATIDEKSGKIIPPPGCIEAYQKYLDLAPTGPFAPDVKAVLAEVATTVKTTYKAKK
ncbi:MAG TPA: tetratricopeptide repeat protein [Acidisarcina sp.]